MASKFSCKEATLIVFIIVETLLPSDYRPFPALKKNLDGHKFEDHPKVETDVTR
jgi:hypothetical protein